MKVFFLMRDHEIALSQFCKKVRYNPGSRLRDTKQPTIENRGCLCLCLYYGQTFKSVPWPCMFGAIRSF